MFINYTEITTRYFRIPTNRDITSLTGPKLSMGSDL